METQRRMRAKAPTYRLLFAAAVLALAGCGGDKAAQEAPRPVLVVRPGGGDAATLSAYAGEVRA